MSNAKLADLRNDNHQHGRHAKANVSLTTMRNSEAYRHFPGLKAIALPICNEKRAHGHNRKSTGLQAHSHVNKFQ